MRKWIAFSMFLLLSGCSMVTIDEPLEHQQPEKMEQIVEQQAPEAQQERFIEVLEQVFHFNWSERKYEDAEMLYYLALGDSLTRGVGDELGQYGYTGRLAETLELWPAIREVELDNRGKNGRRSEKVLELLQRGHYDTELAQADFITMTVGGNDVMKVVRTDLFSLKKMMFDEALIPFTESYTQILKEIRLRNAEVPIILVGFYNPFSIITDEFTPFETIIDEWNTEMETVARTDVNACFVPISDLFVSNDDLVYHTDFFHPNATGYERMTTRIIETMVQCDIETMSAGFIGFEEGKDE